MGKYQSFFHIRNGIIIQSNSMRPQRSQALYIRVDLAQNREKSLAKPQHDQPTSHHQPATSHHHCQPTNHRWGSPMENLQPQHDFDGRTIALAAGFSLIGLYGLYSLHRPIQAIYRLGLRSAIVVPFTGPHALLTNPPAGVCISGSIPADSHFILRIPPLRTAADLHICIDPRAN